MVLDLLRDRTTTQRDCGMVLQEYRLPLSKVAHNLPVLILYHTRLVLGCEKDRSIIEYLGLRSYNLSRSTLFITIYNDLFYWSHHSSLECSRSDYIAILDPGHWNCPFLNDTQSLTFKSIATSQNSTWIRLTKWLGCLTNSPYYYFPNYVSNHSHRSSRLLSSF